MESWLKDQQTRLDLAYLQRAFEVEKDRAVELLLLFQTWDDMEPVVITEEDMG
jgi:hypothetical protein